MNPITFDETGNPGGTDSGWKTAYTNDSSDGVQRAGTLTEENKEAITLRPRVLTKTNAPQNSMPGNIGRPEREITQETSWNSPGTAPVLFQPKSQSAKDFYYAPGEAEEAPPLLHATSTPVSSLPLDLPADAPTDYRDSDSNLTLSPEDGYSKLDNDSNVARDPMRWRFRKKDRDVDLNDRGETPLNVEDVGRGEMVYPIVGDLRPVVFKMPKNVKTYKDVRQPLDGPQDLRDLGTGEYVHPLTNDITAKTARQREQAKRLNRERAKRHKEKKPEAEPKAEEKKIEELAKKAEAKPEPAKEPVQEPAKKEGLQDKAAGFKFSVESDPGTLSTVVTVYDSRNDNKVLRYGLDDGKPVMQPTYDESGDGPRWIEALTSVYKNLSEIFPDYVPTQYLPEPPSEVTDKLGGIRPQQHGATPRSGYRGNVLEDPALEGMDMQPQEKLFTTIRRWDGDSYVTDGGVLDAGTKEVLAQKPVGAGKYFDWQYVTSEESEKGAAEDVKKEGYTVRSGEGVLRVRRLAGWKQAEADVQRKRRTRPA